MIPEKQVCGLIDETLRSGVTSSGKISEIIERKNGIEVPPHFIAEYKYRKRHNEEMREDFFNFGKEKPEGTKNLS